MSKLLSIAKRQHRKGVADHVIVDVHKLADQLELEILPTNSSAEDIVDRAKKEHAPEVSKARRATFRMLVENRDRNRHDSAERNGLFDEIVSVILDEYPSWENVFARGIANTARSVRSGCGCQAG